MSFEEHAEFEPPSSPNNKIWRYIDLAKFLSILEKESLYFARIDQLSEFDPFEGYYTDANLAFDRVRFEDMTEEWKEYTGIKNKGIFSSIAELRMQSRMLVKSHRSKTFVNSWHLKDHESAAMWKVYLSGNEGIAIQSTYQKLVDALASYEDFRVHVGRIKYIDYQREVIPMGNTLSPFMYKRKSFEYEDELRALIWTPQDGKNSLVDSTQNKYHDVYGLNVPVDLKTLIERIYVSPSAPAWIGEIVRSVTSKYGLKKDVIHSGLSSRPVY